MWYRAADQMELTLRRKKGSPLGLPSSPLHWEIPYRSFTRSISAPTAASFCSIFS